MEIGGAFIVVAGVFQVLCLCGNGYFASFENLKTPNLKTPPPPIKTALEKTPGGFPSASHVKAACAGSS